MPFPMRAPIHPEADGLTAYGQGLTDEELEQLDQQLTDLIDAWFAPGANPERSWDRMLLHICCGPCATFPLEILKRYGGVEGAVFYNPNIQPEAEFQRRFDYARLVMEAEGIALTLLGGSDEALWRSWSDRTKTEHCGRCYGLRMKRVAAFAKEHGYDAFGTVLTVSPYQDYARLTQAGHVAARSEGIRFIELDYRPGYRVGQLLARRDRLYRQKYCGCIYSIKESSFETKICKDLKLEPAELPVRTY